MGNKHKGMAALAEKLELRTNIVDYDDVKRRAERKFRVIDNLPREVRAVIQEFGWEPVKELMDLGCKSPGRLRHIIMACKYGKGGHLN